MVAHTRTKYVTASHATEVSYSTPTLAGRLLVALIIWHERRCVSIVGHTETKCVIATHVTERPYDEHAANC